MSSAGDARAQHAMQETGGVVVAPNETLQRWHAFLPFIEVHTHLQAAALRLYPGCKLLLPERSAHHTKCIRAIASRDAPDAFKFDVAQVWHVHSPSSYVTPYGFRRALTGENQDSPTSELDTRKYPSLEILKYCDPERPTKFKYRAIMNAEDMLKFMLSDFARKGQYDEIFDKADSEVQIVHSVPGDPIFVKQEQPHTEHEQRDYQQRDYQQRDYQQRDHQQRDHQQRSQHSPRRVFSSICLARIREVEQHFETLCEIEGAEGDPAHERHRAKRRKLLGNATMKSMSRILFDANKLVLDSILSGV